MLVRPPETHMRLRDVMALLKNPTPEAFYVEYNAAHQYLGERLQAIAPLPPHPPSLRPLLQNLWLGKGATTSPLHYDDYENLLTQAAPAPHVPDMRRCTHPSAPPASTAAAAAVRELKHPTRAGARHEAAAPLPAFRPALPLLHAPRQGHAPLPVAQQLQPRAALPGRGAPQSRLRLLGQRLPARLGPPPAAPARVAARVHAARGRDAAAARLLAPRGALGGHQRGRRECGGQLLVSQRAAPTRGVLRPGQLVSRAFGSVYLF